MTKRRRSKTAPEAGAAPTLADPEPPTLLGGRILALGATIYGLAIAILSGNPSPTTWGLDASGYLPAPLRLPLLGVIAAGIVLVWTAVFRRAADGGIAARQPHGRGHHVPAWAPIASLGVIVPALWILHVRSFFLGDQMVWLQNLRAGQFPLYSEPVASVVWHGYVVVLAALGVAITEQSLIVLPILCGAVAVLLAWKISRFIAEDAVARLTGVGLIAFLGTTQLFCGYIESYPIVCLSILLYLFGAIRFLRGEGGAALVGIALALAIATHLIALVLIPSYLVLVLRSPVHAWRRVLLLLVPVVVGAGVGWLLALDASDLMRPFDILRVAVQSSAQGANPPSMPALLVGRPLAELGNLILLVMPIPALLIASYALTRAGERRDSRRDLSFLTWAAMPGIAAVAVLSLPGSPAQDWDLLSVAVLPAAVLGVFLGLARAPRPLPRRLALGLMFLSAGSLLAFVLVNADEDAGTRRFKTIIAASSAMSPHERAYANEKLVKYYTARKGFDSVYVYARRAQAAEPGNTRYWGNIGTALYNLHRYDEAARYFEEALRRGSDRMEVYYNLGLCYMRTQRYPEALRNFRIAIDLGGERPHYLNSLGMALLATGNPESARATWLYVRKRWPDFEPTARALDYYFGPSGAPFPVKR
jgi:tetratricopeptide (TPR) repeat protein